MYFDQQWEPGINLGYVSLLNDMTDEFSFTFNYTSPVYGHQVTYLIFILPKNGNSKSLIDKKVECENKKVMAELREIIKAKYVDKIWNCASLIRQTENADNLIMLNAKAKLLDEINSDHDTTWNINGWRERRLLDTLLFAERQHPGINKDVEQMNDHEGQLAVTFKSIDSSPYEQIFRNAWEFVGEQTGCVEFEYLDSPVPK